jgi:PAS domain S-box-containing protein
MTMATVTPEHELGESPRTLEAAEAAARRSREDLADFLDHAPVPIHSLDGRGTILWANRAELELLGFAADEYIGKPLSAFLVDPAALADMLARVTRGESLHDYEIRMRAKDGSIRHVLVSSNLAVRDGQQAQTRCFSRDITDRKRAEEDRDRVIADLSRTVRLNDMFAGILGHDLRGPLSTIVMASQLLMGYVDEPKGVRTIQRVLNSADRMQRMINQLLDFARARMDGGLELERRAIDLAEIARDVAEEVRFARPEWKIDIELHGEVRGELDGNRLSQVFSNLVGNAAQHGSPDVPLSIRLDGRDPTSIQVEIANRGTISPDLVPILFSPFRGSQHKGLRSQGLGLGLFITEQIVRAHGGRIDVESTGGMTAFRFSLPRRTSGEAQVATFDAEPARGPDRAGERGVPPAEVGAFTDETLRLLLGGIRDYAIFMLDPRGYIMGWNRGAHLLHGYTSDEAIGRHCSILSRPEDARAGKWERDLGLARSQGQHEEEGWRVRKDGTTFWAHALLTAIHDATGRLVGFAEVTRDKTESKLAHEAARQNEERFRVLIDGVKDYAIFMLDSDGNVATWNTGAQRIKGYAASEIIGQHFSVFYPEHDIRAGKTEFELRMALRDGRFEDEGWRLRKDGTMFWANVTITALRDASGALLGYAKITRDLTERRKLEHERIQLARTQEAVRLRDEFLSLASHELKTPLTVLQLQLEALRERAAADDSSTIAKLDRSARAGQRLAELIEALLDVSRIATGRFELCLEETDLADIVATAVDRMHEAAEAAGCPLSVTLEHVTGLWDRSRIDQVISNLVSNATRYAAGTPIEIAVTSEGGAAVLEVRDRGPGVPAGELGRIFDRFERCAPMRHYGGLGLGLYVVRQITEAHGGSVTADNRSDGGARFIVRLPVRSSQRDLVA